MVEGIPGAGAEGGGFMVEEDGVVSFGDEEDADEC